MSGLVTGIEIGLLNAGIGRERSRAVLLTLESIALAADISIDNYASLPSLRECGVIP